MEGKCQNAQQNEKCCCSSSDQGPLDCITKLHPSGQAAHLWGKYIAKVNMLMLSYVLNSHFFYSDAYIFTSVYVYI